MDLLYMGRKPRDGGWRVRKIKMLYIHAPVPHVECGQYALQTNTNKNRNHF